MAGLNDQMFGRWLSANETVISVDTMSGKAEAIGYGTTQGIEHKTYSPLLSMIIKELL